MLPLATLWVPSVDLSGTWSGTRVVSTPGATEAQRATALLKAGLSRKGDILLILRKDHVATVRFKGPDGKPVVNRGAWSQKGLHLIVVSKPMKPTVMIAEADGKKLVAWNERGETEVVFRRAGK